MDQFIEIIKGGVAFYKLHTRIMQMEDSKTITDPVKIKALDFLHTIIHEIMFEVENEVRVKQVPNKYPDTGESGTAYDAEIRLV